MEPRFDGQKCQCKGLGKLVLGLVISRFIFIYFTVTEILVAEEYRPLYRGLCYTEVTLHVVTAMFSTRRSSSIVSPCNTLVKASSYSSAIQHWLEISTFLKMMGAS